MTDPASANQPRPIKVICPECGTRAMQVTHVPAQSRYLLRCWNCPDGSTGEWLSKVARKLGTYPDKLIRQGLAAVPESHRHLLESSRTGSRGKPLAPMSKSARSFDVRNVGHGPDYEGSPWGHFPSRRDIERMSTELLRSPDALEARLWLKNERLISRDALRAAQVGWWSRPQVLVFPLFSSDGRLVNAKVRRIGRGWKPKSWPKSMRPAVDAEDAFPLFPVLLAWDKVVVCAGELDALALLSRGINAVSVTAGAGTWYEGYTQALRGHHVVIAFDRGEEHAAMRASGLLPHARVHRWPKDAMPDNPKLDVTDWLKEGHDLTRLK